ncbi:MAG: radical SAM protein [Eubacterium sp.]|nr:radical SAM protein [Eubacterium sp.]
MTESDFDFKERISEKWIYPKMWGANVEGIALKEYMIHDYPEEDKPVRLYIHIPFCQAFCCFCPYYKEPYNKLSDADKEKFVNALIKEITMYSKQPYFETHNIGTIYFGGGDPGLIEGKYIQKIFEVIFKNFKMNKLTQITVEGSVLALLDRDNWKIYKDAGVNRISYGVQTFDEELRKKLRLKPSLSDIDKVVDYVHKYDFPDHSIDLMYNIPDQSVESVINDVKKAVKLDATYVDDYSMNLFPNTVFKKMVDEGKVFANKPSNEKMLEMFQAIQDVFKEYHYDQVASMIFSKNHSEAHDGLVHFLKGYPMIGIGPSARGYLGRFNYRNVCSVEKYIDLIEQNRLPVENGQHISEELAYERSVVFFPILLKISKSEIKYYSKYQAKIDNLVRNGYITIQDDIIKLTQKGIVWAGNIQHILSDDDELEKDQKEFVKAILKKTNPYNQDYMGVSRRK